MRSILAVVLLLFSFSAWSENPAPSATKAGSPNEPDASQGSKKSTDLQGNSEKPPIILNNEFEPSIGHKWGGNKADDRDAESPWKGVWEAIVALATVVLAAITGWLVYYTRRLWGITVKLSEEAKSSSDRQFKQVQDSLVISRDAAIAAQVSADAARREFLASHRPQIIVRRVVLSDTNEVIFSVTNRGANEAKNIVVSARLWLPDGSLPAIPPYASAIREADTLSAGDTNTFRREIDPTILAEHEFKTGFYQVARGRPNTDPSAQEPR